MLPPLLREVSHDGTAQMREYEVHLRRLAINDTRYLDSILRSEADPADPFAHELDPCARSLIRLGILVALDGPPSAFEWTTAEALASGATADQLVEVLIAAAPLVGSSRVVSAAPRLARALGYDIDADLERLETPST